MTLLEQGNNAFRNREFGVALKLYNDAIKQNGNLKEILEFNISVCLRNLDGEQNSEQFKTNLSDKNDEQKTEVIKQYLEYRKTRKASVVVYMAIIGGYDQLILPDELVYEWDYVLFTEAELSGLSPFEVRRPVFTDSDTVRTARYHKLNPHLVLKEYAYTIWIDGNVLVKSNSFRELIEEEIELGTDILMRKHPDRTCTYDEIFKCRELLKDDFGVMSRQLKKYESEGFPKNIGLYETNVILRSNQSILVKHFNECWWDELSKGSRRDQLSCVYALNKIGLTPELFPENTDIRDPKNKFYALFSHNASANKKQVSYKPESIFSLKSTQSKEESDFVYDSQFKGYSFSKSPYKSKRAFLLARNLNFYDEGLNELQKLSVKGSRREREWANWFLVMLLAHENDSESHERAVSYLSNSELPSELANLDKFKSFMLRELNPTELSNAEIVDEELDIDTIIQAIAFESDAAKKVDLFNLAFSQYGLQRVRVLGNSINYLDYLCPESPIKRSEYIKSNIKVSIIIPCFKCAETIQTTLYSLVGQTWLNIEILLVDDCSPDNTMHVLEHFAALDKRIRILSTPTNSGPYVARNIALKHATGQLVTVCDSDDWCHPQKIEYQVRHFESNGNIVANCASWVRCDESFNFIRRGQPFYAHLNISSLMFRREEVLSALGGWDEVRFAADGEFYKRLIVVFGRDKVIELKGITSIGRVEPSSLTNSSYFGYNGFPYGARLEYIQTYETWHNKDADLKHLHYEPGASERKYPVPLPMMPSRCPSNKAHYQSVLACDLRDPNLESNILEFVLREQRNNRTWTLVQIDSPLVDSRNRILSKVRSLLMNSKTCISVFGEFISCERMYYFESGTHSVEASYVPSIEAELLNIVLCNPSGTDDVKVNSLKDSLARMFKVKETQVQYLNRNYIPKEKDIEGVDCYFEDIITINTSELSNCTLNVSPSVTIVMPCIDEEMGTKTAEILSSRAGTHCTVVVAMDDSRNGFMNTLNSVARKCDSRFIVFVAQDAFPGRQWLKIALDSIEAKSAGLLAFNDGKWFGRIASFGLVRKSWIQKFYDDSILNPYYKAHKADNEITLLARLDEKFVYEPDSVLIEVDYGKDRGGSNPEDNEKFKLRFNSQFDGIFATEQVESYRKEYKVKND